MNLKEIKELIEIIRGTEISEIELEREGSRVRIRLGEDRSIQRVAAPSLSGGPGRPEEGGPPPDQGEAAAEAAVPEMAPDQLVMTSPMVGTFYRSPTPGAPPFVEVGNTVEKGQTLCIIEAMKLMNEIEAEHSGRLLKILKEDKDPVEYGEALFILKPLG